MKRTLLSAAIASILFAPAYAEQLDPIFVMGDTYLQSDPFLTSSMAETYTAEDIRESGASTLTEFLNTHTQILAVPNSGNPLSPKLQMPGYGSEAGFESLKVILDGQSLNNIDLLPSVLASINLESIQSVTVVQNSGSVEFGDNALAGALIIHTHQSTQHNTASIGTQYGINGDWRRFIRASLSNRTESGARLHANIVRERHTYDGDRIIQNDGTRNDRLADTLQIELGLLGKRYRADIILRNSHGHLNYPGRITLTEFYQDPATNPNKATFWKYDHKDKIIDLSWLASKQIKIHYNLALTNQISAYPFYQPIYSRRQHHIEIVRRVPSSVMRMGFDFDEGMRTALGTELNKNDRALFAKAVVRFGRDTRINVGLHHASADYVYQSTGARLSDSQDSWGWNMGINHILTAHDALFANINHGYVFPNVDRFFTFGGNFNGFIRPMEGTIWTAGIKFRHSWIDGRFYGAYHDLNDEFYYDAVQGKNTNLSKTHKTQWGLQVNAHLDNSELSLTATHTNSTIDQATGVTVSDLPGAPSDMVRSSWQYDFKTPWFAKLPKQRITLQHQWTSGTLAESDFNHAFGTMPGSRRTDLSLTLSNRHLNLQFGIKNLFNEHNANFVYSSRKKDISVYPYEYTRTYYAAMRYEFDL